MNGTEVNVRTCSRCGQPVSKLFHLEPKHCIDALNARLTVTQSALKSWKAAAQNNVSRKDSWKVKYDALHKDYRRLVSQTRKAYQAIGAIFPESKA